MWSAVSCCCGRRHGRRPRQVGMFHISSTTGSDVHHTTGECRDVSARLMAHSSTTSRTDKRRRSYGANTSDRPANYKFVPTPLFAAKLREKTKREKYTPVAARDMADFHGLVMESYGAVGPDTMRIIEVLNNHHKAHAANSNWSLANWAIRVLSFALQRGNGQLAFTAFRQDRSGRV